jgi:hypothetical protein
MDNYKSDVLIIGGGLAGSDSTGSLDFISMNKDKGWLLCVRYCYQA